MNKITALCTLFIVFISCFSCSRKQQTNTEEVESVWIDTIPHTYRYGICIDSLDVTEYPIRNGDNLALIFSKLGISATKGEIITASCKEVLDPAKLQAGMHYAAFTTQDSLKTLKYMAFAKSKLNYAIIDLTGDSVRAYEYIKDITLQRNYVEGTLNTSLWNVLKAQGTDPLLAIMIADVYAWQIDFFDVKEGDSFKVLYDLAFIDDTIPLHISSIQGAVFTHKGKDFTAIPFLQDSISEYFDEEGNSLRKAFLKAPMDFFRITSRFTNSRYHPVLKRYRAHHGVDYAAPTGTPVKTIGDGTVVGKGFQAGGGGNFLKVKHNSVYTTTYMHLSKFAQGIKIGSHVRQGEVIGYVGSTGLSTGPHLDFRVHKNGQPVNPLTMEAPPSEPVKPELRDSFEIIKKQILAEIDTLGVTFASANPSIIKTELKNDQTELN